MFQYLFNTYNKQLTALRKKDVNNTYMELNSRSNQNNGLLFILFVSLYTTLYTHLYLLKF